MAEPVLVVESREHLWYLLAEAAQVEHMIMCQYLYATFSLKLGVDEGLTDVQAAAVSRWRAVLDDITIQEMLHLSLVANVMAAIGVAPTLARPNFPQRSGYFPPSVQLDLLPFGEAGLTHFLYLERPEGMERADAEGFVPTAPPHEPLAAEELLPRVQDFATVGHLYRGIANGLSHLVDRFGERAVFVGAESAQTRAELLRWPQLVAVTNLESAHAAIEEIIDQGEGARGDWRAAHYGRFLDVWSEYHELKAADPSFEPARPVQAAFVKQPYDVVAPQTLVTDPAARAVAELFNLAYEAVLQTLTRLFTHTDETDAQLETLAGSAIRLMTGVLRPLGSSLTGMPVGDEHPGRTVGPSFEMYYPMGNFVPWRDSAWAVLTERVTVLADRCDAVARRGDVPGTIATVAAPARAIAADLAAQVPHQLLAESTDRRRSREGPAERPTSATDHTEEDRGMALPDEGETVSFAAHIQGLFRERDRQSMSYAFDLWSYEDVKAHAQPILGRLRAGTMPCDGAWSVEKIDALQRWIDGGMTA